MTGPSFLPEPAETAERRKLYDDDVDDRGYVMNASRLWAHDVALHEDLFHLIGAAARTAGLSIRERGVLVTACASTLGDSYCSLAWGKKLADETADAELAAGVLTGADGSLTAAEQALADWARKVTRDPNATSAADVQALRDAGYDDARILGITTFVALRLAFSTVNDALGATPDRELLDSVPDRVRDAVTWGRPPA